MISRFNLPGQENGIEGTYTELLGHYDVRGGGHAYVIGSKDEVILNQVGPMSQELSGLYFPEGEEVVPSLQVDGQGINQEGGAYVCMDFSNVKFLSSLMLCKFISVNKKLKLEGNGGLELSGMKPEVYDIFTLTNLTKTFRIRKSLEDFTNEFPPA
jgi:anti-anti-sigma regulatory factor